MLKGIRRLQGPPCSFWVPDRARECSKSQDLQPEQPGTSATGQSLSESPIAPLGMLRAELSPCVALPMQQAACDAPGDS